MIQQYTITVTLVMMFAGICGIILRRHFIFMVYCAAISFLGMIMFLACLSSPGDVHVVFIAGMLVMCAMAIFVMCALTYIFIVKTTNTTVIAEFRKLRG